MKEYVVGFMFSIDNSHVLLIEKQKPTWQKGKINGIGGKLKENETPIEAMKREFKEEAGIEGLSWKPFCSLVGEDWKVYFFVATGDITKSKHLEEEKPIICRVRDLPLNVISNLNWLIPLALDSDIMVIGATT